MVLDQDTDEVYAAQCDTAQQRYSYLLPPRLGKVLGGDLIQRQTADDHGRSLTAAVSAGIHDLRDKGDQQRNADKGSFIVFQHGAGHHGGEHQHHQPDNTVLCQRDNGGTQVGIITGGHTCHLFKVLGVLILDDIYRVIDGDDTNDPIFAIHYRHGQHIVPAEHLGDLFLVIMGMHMDGIGVHQCINDGLRGGEEHLTHRHHAQQLLAGRGHIAGVDGFLIYPVLAYNFKSLGHGNAAAEVDILVGHQTSGRILRVL